jgi:PAS domain S-box-containing protein
VATSPEPQVTSRGADRYMLAWVAAAALLVAVLVLVTDHGVWQLTGITSVAVYVVAVAAAERVELRLNLENRQAVFTLIEVAITAGLLLLPGTIVVVGAMVGATLSQLLRGLHGTSAWFNVAIATTGSAVAAGVLAIFPTVGPLVSGRPVIGALLGMLGYAVMNGAAISGVVLRSAIPEPREELRRQLPFFVSTTFGATAVGVVVAAIWVTEPVLALLALVPAAAIYLAAKGTHRANELLAEVRTERDRLTLVVDGASDGILLLDRAGEVQLWSRGMESMTGIASSTAVGRPVADLLTDTRRRATDNVRGAWLLATADGQTRRGRAQRELNATLIHRDGTAREVRESHALLTDDRGRLIGDVVVVRDVSRQAQLERLRSDFVARVSHELRSPLTPIRGLAQTLRLHDAQLTDERRQQVLDHLVERSDHLGRLIDDLLLVTRVDTEDLHDLMHVTAIGLCEVVEDEVTRFSHLHPRRTVEVERPSRAVTAMADPDHVARIIGAVLDNADRYAPAQEPVRVVITEGPGGPVVRISDRGPGIPEEQRDAVFEPFHRLEDPLTMRTGGVGLGLFLARRLAELMGGALALSAPLDGIGTTLELRLPTTGPRSELRPRPTVDHPVGFDATS